MASAIASHEAFYSKRAVNVWSSTPSAEVKQVVSVFIDRVAARVNSSFFHMTSIPHVTYNV